MQYTGIDPLIRILVPPFLSPSALDPYGEPNASSFSILT